MRALALVFAALSGGIVGALLTAVCMLASRSL